MFTFIMRILFWYDRWSIPKDLRHKEYIAHKMIESFGDRAACFIKRNDHPDDVILSFDQMLQELAAVVIKYNRVLSDISAGVGEK